ncbi:MAG TPA: sigma factor-like helix-turn-helix DNA-binding protein [Bryobacteraceae bacterium]|nr:sigma factor-like helix-turn-helix DNA-binding protein [Bryobacteraceae bacterium]
MLAGVPEDQRDVLTLYYLQEQGEQDVALLVDLPEGTVKAISIAPAARWRL